MLLPYYSKVLKSNGLYYHGISSRAPTAPSPPTFCEYVCYARTPPPSVQARIEVYKFINKLSPLVKKCDDHQQTKFYCPSSSINHSVYDWLINLVKDRDIELINAFIQQRFMKNVKRLSTFITSMFKMHKIMMLLYLTLCAR